MFKYLEERKTYLVYLPLFLYWVILLIATSLPAPDLPDIGGSDKVKHFGAYLILAVLINLALLVQGKYHMTNKKAAYITVIGGLFYGIFDELHQMFIPGRSAELLDLVADVLGTITGVLIVLYLVKKNTYNHT